MLCYSKALCQELVMPGTKAQDLTTRPLNVFLKGKYQSSQALLMHSNWVSDNNKASGPTQALEILHDPLLALPVTIYLCMGQKAPLCSPAQVEHGQRDWQEGMYKNTPKAILTSCREGSYSLLSTCHKVRSSLFPKYHKGLLRPPLNSFLQSCHQSLVPVYLKPA